MMHVRLQSWLPFPVQICLNGQEWLRRQLDKEGVGHEMVENSFVRIDDWERAQELADTFAGLDWPAILSELAGRAPSIRANARRCPPASTTEMFTFNPISSAFFSPPRTATLAPPSCRTVASVLTKSGSSPVATRGNRLQVATRETMRWIDFMAVSQGVPAPEVKRP